MRSIVLSLSFLAFLATPVGSKAATYAQQRTELNRVGTLLRSAERFAKAKRTDEAAAAFTDAQEKLQQLTQEGVDERLGKTLARTVEAIAEQHAALSSTGVKLPDLVAIDLKAALASTSKPGGRLNPDDVSFTKEIAPMLAAKCGTCHIDQKRGTFSLSSYNALMKGSERGGRVITPGVGVGSVIVDMIDSGDMPRGNGPRVTPEELATLVKWINQGAKFDGRNPDQILTMLATGSGAAPAPMPEPMPAAKPAPLIRATGKETVSFALDVAPILMDRCNECHGGNNPSGNLSLATFTQLLRGGDSGAIVGKADPEETLLIKKLRGTAGQRMPLNRPPLSDSQITLLATWIREGSKFDGPDPGEMISRTSAVVRAERATSEELSAIRADLAAQNWHLALPDEPLHQVATERFLLVGSIPEQQLREWGQVAESQVERVLKEVRNSEAPLSKGRVTLYVFSNRIDYGEFATMVERRDTDKGERGNWAFDIVDAYACVLPTLEDSAANESLIAQQIAAIALAERGKGRLPAWLVEGASRAVVAKLAPRDPRVEVWQEQLPIAAAALKQPEDFMRGRLAPEPTGVISFAFVTPLMRSARNFDKLVDGIAKGENVDEALKKAYRYDSAQLAKLWYDSNRRGGR